MRDTSVIGMALTGQQFYLRRVKSCKAERFPFCNMLIAWVVRAGGNGVSSSPFAFHFDIEAVAVG
jgi:hypothetical protein